ncbi:LysR family transcriptional regulator [Arenibaculum sp.]|uniref:LysR family transcriptional regulator n=1 Tax=Arenibaculum sp. TaxID=2865862 RepID=UPI002E0F75DE|nr:LysR family transcriptional regulator [Arenibaculum sp.]
MPVLEPELLKAFVAVAERGGFTAACHALARSQSTVSMQIRRLEDAVGRPLFSRTTHAVRLTAEGEILLGYAHRLLALGEEAVCAARGGEAPVLLRIGCVEDWAVRVLPERLSALRRTEVNVQVEVTTDTSAALLSRLGHHYDLVVCMHAPGTGRGRILSRQRLVWGVPAGRMDLANERPLPLALHPEGCLYRRWATRALDQAAIGWRAVYTSAGVGAVEAAVRSGLALSAFPASTLAPGLAPASPGSGLPALPQVEVAAHLAESAPRAAGRLCDLLVDTDAGTDQRDASLNAANV